MSGLKKVRIWRSSPDGPVPELIDAGPTPVPGLVVGYYPYGPNAGWNVIHEGSGFGVSSADSPEHALAIAVALRDVADWTQRGSALQSLPGIREAVIRAAGPAGGRFGGPIATPDVVAAAEARGAP